MEKAYYVFGIALLITLIVIGLVLISMVRCVFKAISNIDNVDVDLNLLKLRISKKSKDKH